VIRQSKEIASSRNKKRQKSLHDCVEASMKNYFEDLDGHGTRDLYALFMSEVEKPFFKTVMEHTRGNISQASALLGLNRVTLRNRLKKYGLD